MSSVLLHIVKYDITEVMAANKEARRHAGSRLVRYDGACRDAPALYCCNADSTTALKPWQASALES